MKKFLHGLLISFLLFVPILSSAQGVSVSAWVDKENLSVDDELTLVVEVKGNLSGTVLMPELPSLPAFNVYSREVEQASVNGNNYLVFRYTMLPRFVGNTTIGAVTFQNAGKTYRTRPIAIHIFRSAQDAAQAASKQKTTARNGNKNTASFSDNLDPDMPALEYGLSKMAIEKARQGNPFFLVANTSTDNPYVNENVTLGVRFYYSAPFAEAHYKTPVVSNFFVESLPILQGTQKIDGKIYHYEEQRYLLTPPSTGIATIAASEVTLMKSGTMLSVFDRMFGGAAVSKQETVTSPSIHMQVKALPQKGKSNSFYGAVGTIFSISAEVDRTSVEAGEAISLTVRVVGDGNLKTTRDIKIPNLAGWKIYESAGEAGFTSAQNGPVRGYKTTKAILIPTASGEYQFPALEWSYFNPSDKRYYRISTKPITFTISPSTQKTPSSFNFGSNSPISSGFETLGKDISYLKTMPLSDNNFLVKAERLTFVNWIALGLAFFSILLSFIGRVSISKKKAFLTAKASLKKAFSEEQVADTISAYLQQKLAIYTGSLPLKDIKNALIQKGISPATVESFALLWQRLDAARFAPEDLASQSALELSAQALDVIKLIEEELK